MQNNDTMHYDTCKTRSAYTRDFHMDFFHMNFMWNYHVEVDTEKILCEIHLKATFHTIFTWFLYEYFTWNLGLFLHMEFFHRSFHVNIFMWISHAAILPVYKFVSRFRKLLWQDPYIFMLLHVFVKKMYSHKQSIEQKYYVRVEYALKKSYHYQRPCLSPLFKTGKNPNSCFSFVCLFVLLLLLVFFCCYFSLFVWPLHTPSLPHSAVLPRDCPLSVYAVHN